MSVYCKTDDSSGSRLRSGAADTRGKSAEVSGLGPGRSNIMLYYIIYYDVLWYDSIAYDR